jgi:lipopolysaccharide/colanic/teichoic acid biosynthesis glycosyltransferase
MTIKRSIDLLITIVALPLLLPMLLVIGILVRWRLGSPIFFKQFRPGLYGKAFQMIKFRTMHNINDSQGNYLSDEARLSRFGCFLRATSLDELPELWNVLKGDMSLVGPRPLLIEYLPLYSHDQARRHEVKPGITGWAQVNGRNAISWEDKFKLDVWYVDHQSLKLDLKILWLTIISVFSRHGINEPGQVTMSKFTGTGRR